LQVFVGGVENDDHVGDHKECDEHESDGLHELFSLDPLIINEPLNSLLRVEVHVFSQKVFRQLQGSQFKIV
jgi:hypothetical protein